MNERHGLQLAPLIGLVDQVLSAYDRTDLVNTELQLVEVARAFADTSMADLYAEDDVHDTGRLAKLVVDPCDGSDNFDGSIGRIAFSAAWVVADQIQGGLVIDLESSAVYCTELDEIRPATRSTPPVVIVAADETSVLSDLNRLPGIPERFQIRAVGSSALALAMVAVGQASAFVDLTKSGAMAWDVMGGVALCQSQANQVLLGWAGAGVPQLMQMKMDRVHAVRVAK